MLAAASDAIIIGFHVKADPKAEEIAEKEGVDLRFYNIIYEVVEDVRKALEGLLEPTFKEVSEGRIQIRKVFKISRYGNVGGGMVIKGKVMRANRVRVLRDNIVVFEGKLSSLKRFKDDVREVAQGYECGVTVEGFDDLREGDVLESYRIDKVATRLTAPSSKS
jgi:translation initiation factor IF-2